MRYFVDNDGSHVRVEKDNIVELIGSINKTETSRLDAETVEDTTYQFVISEDGESGGYVEQSRTTRNEPQPPEPETDKQKIDKLHAENVRLNEIVVGQGQVQQELLELLIDGGFI